MSVLLPQEKEEEEEGERAEEDAGAARSRVVDRES